MPFRVFASLGVFQRTIAYSVLLSIAGAGPALYCQTGAGNANENRDQEIRELREAVRRLQRQVDELEARSPNGKTVDASQGQASGGTEQNNILPTTAGPANAPSVLTADDRGILDYLRGTTIDFAIDGYYDFNFNHPIGRVNALRAYDVLSNNISLNQANVIFERAPDVETGRRYGARLDLQFGQATDTLQGNPLNEPRPQIYRNIFQAYGTYIIPAGNGITVDIGKWSSSIGIEGNYTKDQINYSRAFWFDFLPFYHLGVRATYKVNDKLAVNYWLVNGTN